MSRPLKLPKSVKRDPDESRALWNEARSVDVADFYTVGYQGRKLDQLVRELQKANVQLVLDVRFAPISMYRPEMSKSNIERTLGKAGIQYGRYLFGVRKRRRKLEGYLEAEFPGKRSPGDKGRRTVLHLVSELRMSEEEVLKAAFDNPRILSSTAADPETRRAAALFFEYKRQ